MLKRILSGKSQMEHGKTPLFFHLPFSMRHSAGLFQRPVNAHAAIRMNSQPNDTVAEGESREAVVEPGVSATLAPSAPAGAPPTTKAIDHPPPPAPAPGAHTGRPVYGYVLLGAGAVGLATGAITGILALSRAGTVKDHCGPDYATCDAASADAAKEGKTFATVSTVGFIAGAALAGAGLYFLLTAPTSSKGTALTLSPTGAAISGQF